MSNGDYIIGLFNRDDAARSVTVDFADLGISGQYNVRDLWKHADEGTATSLSVNVPAHGCKIVRLSK